MVTRGIVLLAFLVGTWFVLSGMENTFFLSLGLISSVVSVWLTWWLYNDKPVLSVSLLCLWNMPVYMIWLLKEMVLATIATVRSVWALDSDISPSFRSIKTSIKGDIGLTLYANSITLTPGTVAVIVTPGEIKVHALKSSSIDELKKGAMEKKIIRVVGEK